MIPRERQSSPIAGMSWITPISLLTYITETRIVSGRSAASSVAKSSRPSGSDVEVGDLESFALELAHGIERRLVLGADGHQVLALVLVEVRRALHREIDRFGCARGPDDFLRVAIDELGDFVARLFHRVLGFPPERMRARRGVAEMLRQIRNHFRRNARIDRRRRRVVEVDGFFHRVYTVVVRQSWRIRASCPAACGERAAR